MVYKNSKDGEKDMNIKTKISICLILLFVIICTFLPNKIYATDTLSDIMNKSEEFLDKSNEIGINTGNLKETSNFIYNILFTIAVVVAFAVGMIIGIQFITGSVDEKAKIKETLVPYVVGVFVIFGAFTIWKVVTEFGTKLTEASIEEIQNEQQEAEEQRQNEQQKEEQQKQKEERQKEMDNLGSGKYYYCKTCNKRYEKSKYIENGILNSEFADIPGMTVNSCISCATNLKGNITTEAQQPLDNEKFCSTCGAKAKETNLVSYKNALNEPHFYRCQKCRQQMVEHQGIKCLACGEAWTYYSKDELQCRNPNCKLYFKTINYISTYITDNICPVCHTDGLINEEAEVRCKNEDCPICNINIIDHFLYYKNSESLTKPTTVNVKEKIQNGEFISACPNCGALIYDSRWAVDTTYSSEKKFTCPACKHTSNYTIIYEDYYQKASG